MPRLPFSFITDKTLLIGLLLAGRHILGHAFRHFWSSFWSFAHNAPLFMQLSVKYSFRDDQMGTMRPRLTFGVATTAPPASSYSSVASRTPSTSSLKMTCRPDSGLLPSTVSVFSSMRVTMIYRQLPLENLEYLDISQQPCNIRQLIGFIPDRDIAHTD